MIGSCVKYYLINKHKGEIMRELNKDGFIKAPHIFNGTGLEDTVGNFNLRLEDIVYDIDIDEFGNIVEDDYEDVEYGIILERKKTWGEEVISSSNEF
jgi:hypothetical protein